MKESCPKHPKYKGKKQPKYQCLDCLNLYLLRGLKPRGKPIPPTKILPDETKYNRKKNKTISSDGDQ